MRQGVNALLKNHNLTADDLFEEQRNLNYDKKFWNQRSKTVQNKIANHRLSFYEQK